MSTDIAKVAGGVTAPREFRAGGMACGIKQSAKPDLAVVYSLRRSVAAGVFTTNKVAAAPVGWCRGVIGGGDLRAIIANSGNANACTGGQGAVDAREMAVATANSLGLQPRQVLVCSTGRIGRRLPIERIRAAIPEVVAMASARGSTSAARAIMTSDTRPKQHAVETTINGRQIRVGGIAKGAGMVEPSMATMLAFITTDAEVARRPWRRLLREAVELSFNRICVDGDMSTNDSVLALANGAAGNPPVDDHAGSAFNTLREAVLAVCRELARRIVLDAERASRLVEVAVSGARDDADALRAARAVANSLLVKCAWSGGDPNWGRIVCAVGYSGADVAIERVDLDFDHVRAVRGGIEVPGCEKAARRVVAGRRFRIAINLNLGDGQAAVTSSDITPEYVVFNQSE